MDRDGDGDGHGHGDGHEIKMEMKVDVEEINDRCRGSGNPAESKEKMKEGDVSEAVVIPKSSVSHVIGKKGAKLKEIQSRNRVFIYVEKGIRGQPKTDRKATIIGRPKRVERLSRACKRVMMRHQESVSVRAFNTLLAREKGAPPAT